VNKIKTAITIPYKVREGCKTKTKGSKDKGQQAGRAAA
jgi:hypothetical protein